MWKCAAVSDIARHKNFDTTKVRLVAIHNNPTLDTGWLTPVAVEPVEQLTFI